MRLLITGICGFLGRKLAFELKSRFEALTIYGLDNLSRPGSESNRGAFRAAGIKFVHGDIRAPSDLEALPKVDWVIDTAANPSVQAGVNGQASSRQVLEHNLIGTVNLLEYCKARQAGLIMISTSRVYSLEALNAFPINVSGDAFVPRFDQIMEAGVSPRGLSEDFSTRPPLSLYGAAKLASETVVLEYSRAFNFPIHINRCGVMTGAGQFGRPDQGIFSFWIHSFHKNRALKYIGFDGAGHQVRDALHPRDLADLLVKQLQNPSRAAGPLNVSGGAANAMSLAQLSAWCAGRFGPRPVSKDSAPRPFDVPWLVLDSTRAEAEWSWKPATPLAAILEEIAQHAEQNPNWLDLSSDS